MATLYTMRILVTGASGFVGSFMLRQSDSVMYSAARVAEQFGGWIGRKAMKHVRMAVFGAQMALVPAVAMAETYPVRPIKLIVTNPAGGGQDTILRIVAHKLEELFRYTIVPLNMGGAVGEIGKKECGTSTPDGYTICSMGDGVAAVHPAVYAAAGEQIPMSNLTPIGIIADQYFAFVVRSNLPQQTFRDVVEHARQHPDDLVCGTGNTTTGRLGMALLNGIPGVKVREVHYSEGEPRALLDMRAGIIDCGFISLTPTLPHIEAGTVRALGTFGPQKNPFLHDVLTLAELGYPAFGELPSWYSIWGPPNMSAQAVETLSRSINVVLQDSNLQQLFLKNGVSVRTHSSPTGLAAETHALYQSAYSAVCRYRISILGRTCKK